MSLGRMSCSLGSRNIELVGINYLLLSLRAESPATYCRDMIVLFCRFQLPIFRPWHWLDPPTWGRFRFWITCSLSRQPVDLVVWRGGSRPRSPQQCQRSSGRWFSRPSPWSCRGRGTTGSRSPEADVGPGHWPPPGQPLRVVRFPSLNYTNQLSPWEVI